MQNIEVFGVKIEERPFFFEFTKREFLSPCPGMDDLNYDPFPDKQMDDVVRREILCKELILHAKLKGPDAVNYRPGIAVKIDGHTFAITRASGNLMDQINEIEGSEFQGSCEPLPTLAKLREFYAAAKR